MGLYLNYESSISVADKLSATEMTFKANIKLPLVHNFGVQGLAPGGVWGEAPRFYANLSRALKKASPISGSKCVPLRSFIILKASSLENAIL